MKLAVAIVGCVFFAGCNEGLNTHTIMPQLPASRALLAEELFDIALPTTMRFSNSPPIDPLWAAFEGDLLLTFRTPGLDGGPFLDLSFETGLGELTADCMESTGVGPYGYDLTTGAMTAAADLGIMNTTVISFSGTLQKAFFHERLPDVVVTGGGEQTTIIEYIVRSMTVGSGGWSFSGFDPACPPLPGPSTGTWSLELIDELEGETEPDEESELSLLAVQHLLVLEDSGDVVGEMNTEIVVQHSSAK